MFELFQTRNRWLIVAFGIGLLLVLIFFLAYLPAKRPRRPDLYQSVESPRPFGWREGWDFMPLILLLTYVGIFAYSVIDIFLKHRYPPNY